MFLEGATGRRSTVPLTTEDAVCLALSGEPYAPLTDLGTKDRRKTLLIKEW